MTKRSLSVAAPATAAEASAGPISLVVDAGVAIKWYVPEVHNAEAKRLLDPSYTLHVPDLFYAEIGNIVWKKARLLKTPEITVDEGRQILDLVLGVPVTVHPIAPLLKSAYELAVSPARPTVYDCCYLALAERLNCPLVTADRVFHDALQGTPHRPHILWVADPF
jgi:predicted nucleic acid-binding protein